MPNVLIAGNWKMNLDRNQATALAQQITAATPTAGSVDLAVFPPAVYLDAVGQVLADSGIALGAQNVHEELGGAFTGEISTAMLLDLGCQYVILGHSERRHILGETDLDIHRKLRAVLNAELGGRRLTPIVCVGEELPDREAGKTEDIIHRQFEGSLTGLAEDQIARVVIAYEPVWAIGTGRVATPQEAEDVHRHLRTLLQRGYDDDIARDVLILYGGSVKPDNAASLLVQPNVNGALVGGASLKANDFLAIVAAAAQHVASKLR